MQQNSYVPDRRTFFFSLLLFLTIPFLSEKSFSDFTGNLFRQELSGNTLNLHYTLADPAAFGITTDQISFGPFPAEPDQEKPAALQQLKEELESFSSLTEEEQHTKTLLSWWLDGQIALNDFYYFQEPLGPTLGIQAQHSHSPFRICFPFGAGCARLSYPAFPVPGLFFRAYCL